MIFRWWIRAKSLSPIEGEHKCFFPLRMLLEHVQQTRCQILKVEPTTTPARSQLVKMLVAKSTTATLPLHGIRLDQTKGAQVKGRGDSLPGGQRSTSESFAKEQKYERDHATKSSQNRDRR